jgi:hypothetical protein
MLRIISLLLFAVIAFATEVHAGGLKLTLLYSGNTEAEARPCPS